MEDRPKYDSNAGKAQEPEHPAAPGPVQYCPYCGELVGSFWGRRDADGGNWCESCQVFFAVTVS